MADPLLTSLCSICHTLPQKYRCPRCFVLTCSLPCIRRHKQWAQCSGLRDPAAYVKRTDLATPKMIDHDYNYLTSLEREFDKADRDATARGILLDEITGRAAKRNHYKGELLMKEALERCGAIVARAPKGMSRAKANHTHWAKNRRCLVWTVEWVHPDGRKEERACAEDRPLLEEYTKTCKPKGEYVTRKKRKLARETSHAVGNGEEVASRDANPNQTVSAASLDPVKMPVEPNIREDSQDYKGEIAPSHNSMIQTKAVPTDSSSIGIEATVSQVSTSENLNEDQEPLQTELSTPKDPPPVQFAFYLHAPSLPSKETVLIPLEQSATLTCSLRNRLVLEFPTIYVFNVGEGEFDSGGGIPKGFISEEDFFARAKKLLVEEVGNDGVSDVNGNDDERKSKPGIDVFGKDFDAERVLKVLGEDLRGFG